MLISQRTDYLLLGAVLLSALSYFYQVPQNPPGFYIDESSIAYNAYTIAKDGRDEYGVSWPLYFRAFGEYKNPVYIYLLAILFKLFGPGIFVARLLSAGVGALAVLLLWLLAFRISRQTTVASLIAISAALTPWLFENSRLVFEVALYPSLLLIFLLLLYHLSTKETWNPLAVVGLALSLSLLTYSSSIGRLFAPLLAIGLLFFVTRMRFAPMLMTWGLYALALLPGIVFHLRHPNALMSRFWLLTFIGPDKPFIEQLLTFARHYLRNIDPWTIAVTGEINIRDHVGTMGSVLASSLLIALSGVVWVIREHVLGAHASPPARTDSEAAVAHAAGEDACARITNGSRAWWLFVLYALVVSPVPASLTTTEFPQIRLIALPVLLHVMMIPAVYWVLEERKLSRVFRFIAVGLLLLMIVQGVVYRLQFRKAGPERWYIFDEQFPREVLPTALAQENLPIYFYDPEGKSGYVQAYWYGVLRGLPAESFVRVPTGQKLPAGAVVISTAEECSDCRLLLKSINYIVYVQGNVGSLKP